MLYWAVQNWNVIDKELTGYMSEEKIIDVLNFSSTRVSVDNVTRKMEKSSATSDVGLVISMIVRSFIRLIGESVLFLLVSKKCYIFGQVVRFVQKEFVEIY